MNLEKRGKTTSSSSSSSSSSPTSSKMKIYLHLLGTIQKACPLLFVLMSPPQQ
jgi:hypothetical protein